MLGNEAGLSCLQATGTSVLPRTFAPSPKPNMDPPYTESTHQPLLNLLLPVQLGGGSHSAGALSDHLSPEHVAQGVAGFELGTV